MIKLISFLLLIQSSLSFAQNCSSYQDVPFVDLDSNLYYKESVELFELDSLYPSAVLSLPDSGVFINHARFKNAWNLFDRDLNLFLIEHGFVWKENTWSVKKVYFSEEGTIDHLLFKFKEEDLNQINLSLFITLLIEFKSQYKFFVEPRSSFSYCRHTTYTKTEE